MDDERRLREDEDDDERMDDEAEGTLTASIGGGVGEAFSEEVSSGVSERAEAGPKVETVHDDVDAGGLKDAVVRVGGERELAGRDASSTATEDATVWEMVEGEGSAR
ncbi:hypothetical protein CF326_g8807 [Tilletia indica]|nr:hypothetical protein CF326_g8807 [Tilletia indica]